MNATIDTRPVFSLTVSEDNERIKNVVKSVLTEFNSTDPTPIVPERIRINGIRGLSDYLPVSVPTAQKLKNSKKFPFYEAGNKVFFYSDEVDSGLRVAALDKKERRSK